MKAINKLWTLPQVQNKYEDQQTLNKVNFAKDGGRVRLKEF